MKMRISNLFEGFSDLKSPSGKESPDELKSLFNIVCEVFKNTVAPEYVKDWKPVNSVEFIVEAGMTYLNNTRKAKTQNQTVKSLLINDPLYMQAARLADEVYSTDTLNHCVEGWKVCDDFPNIQYNDKTTGLVSRLFVRLNKGKKEYIYATAGTNPKCLEDWKNNLQQLYGGAAQYQQALKNAESIAKTARAENATLLFVGHSLGGGIAVNNALHTGYKAIVFNPAGVSRFTTNGIVPLENEESDYIVSFIITNDILNLLQDTSQNFSGMKQAIPSAIGKRYYIHHAKKSYPLRSHSMTQMIDCMETILHS